ncbi:MAG: DegT/DnrJ/EryC1/StrS family aminotransferase [Desulfovibrionaceae bacterium]|nr:DegT/DnrJ/EryC1/StrS family aminotransferase [Desulfovibrionaceae bacterium]
MELRIPFSGRSIRYTEEEIAVAAEAMRTAEPLTQGRHLRAFESAFARYQGVEDGSCFAVCNGTCALELCAALLRLKPGDEVIIPSHTFTSSAYPFVKQGARIVWCDVDADTHVVSAETVARAMTARTRAVVAVHLYGYAADARAIAGLCRDRGVALIEDAAQSIGSELCGRKTGTFGDMAIFSFHSHKNFTTLGEGGLVWVRDPGLRPIMPMLRHNGHCAWNFDREDYWKPAMGNVDLPMLDGEGLQPANYCLGEVECALGCRLLDRLDSINDAKRARALRFIDALADFPELEFLREPTRRHNYHLLVARMTSGPEARDAFMRRMYAEHGIQCVVQYLPLNRYDYYRRQGFGEADCPNADLFFDTMISFPFQPWMSEEDFDYMLVRTRETLAGLRGN